MLRRVSILLALLEKFLRSPDLLDLIIPLSHLLPQHIEESAAELGNRLFVQGTYPTADGLPVGSSRENSDVHQGKHPIVASLTCLHLTGWIRALSFARTATQAPSICVAVNSKAEHLYRHQQVYRFWSGRVCSFDVNKAASRVVTAAQIW